MAYGANDTYLRLGRNDSGGSNTISIANLPSHSHGLNSHTHGIPALSGSTNSLTLKVAYADGSGSNGSAIMNSAANLYSNAANTFSPVQNHSHTVTTVASITGKSSGNTAVTGDGTSFEPKYVGVYAWKRTK